MQNFFSGKGPIKTPAMIPVQHMIVPSQQQMMGGVGGRYGPVQTFGPAPDEDYGDYDDEDAGYEMYQAQQ